LQAAKQLKPGLRLSPEYFWELCIAEQSAIDSGHRIWSNPISRPGSCLSANTWIELVFGGARAKISNTLSEMLEG
jgi:hypothetical protein